MHLEFLVEEPSMEEVLQNLIPKGFGSDVTFRIHPFQGKHHLIKRLSGRLRGYKKWLPDDWRIIVLVDRDDEDCRELKAKLEKHAADSTFSTRSTSENYKVLNRIVIEELEAWFFGDFQAVAEAYPGVNPNLGKKAGYRVPDNIGQTWEALEKVLQKAGYHRGGLRKVTAAKAISPHMVPSRNTSRSFQVFWGAIVELHEKGIKTIL